MIDKLFATWWAIACGIGLINFLYNQEKQPWSFVGAVIYFLLFLATLYQIKAKQSVWEWLWKLHKRRKAEREEWPV